MRRPLRLAPLLLSAAGLASCGLVLDFDPSPRSAAPSADGGMDAGSSMDAGRDARPRDVGPVPADTGPRDVGPDARDSGRRDGGPVDPDAGCACPSDLATGCADGECVCGGEPACSGDKLCCGSTDALAGCVDPRSDDRHCGSCGNACGANARCVDGACECDDGFASCDGVPGCEVDLTSDPLHCGACDAVCEAARPACADGGCVSCVRDSDCGGSLLACLSPATCDPATGACQAGVLRPGRCFIGGACFGDGGENPLNPCELCDPSAPDRWTPAVGRGCDDGRDCTAADSCDATGRCRGTPEPCEDFNTCTRDFCDVAVTGRCQHDRVPGVCITAGGACVADANPVPGNPCMLCDGVTGELVPAASTTPCDDGNLCNGRERCDGAGRCLAGLSVACPATLPPCVRHECNPATGACDQLLEGTCLIDGVCHSVGSANPANSCLGCAADSPRAWRPINNGLSCSIRDVCRTGTCNDRGMCEALTPPCDSVRHLACNATSGLCTCAPGFASCSGEILDLDGCECMGTCEVGGTCLTTM